VVPRDATGNAINTNELRSYLRTVLPDYMIPRSLVCVDSFPLTPNGKVDRRALPEPACELPGGQSSLDPPQDPTETALAEIWQQLLQADAVGRHQDFFDLGGHSLLAVRLIFRVNEVFHSALKVADVYQHPTIQGLAAQLRGARLDDEVVDLSREASLNGSLTAPAELPRDKPADIFLTGCTGFVGRFLLAQLLQDTDATIHCLVRGDS